MTPAWIKLFDAHTTYADLERVIAEQTQVALDDLSSRIAADPDFTDADRAVLLARAAPKIYALTRDHLESTWLRLRSELGPAH